MPRSEQLLLAFFYFDQRMMRRMYVGFYSIFLSLAWESKEDV